MKDLIHESFSQWPHFKGNTVITMETKEPLIQICESALHALSVTAVISALLSVQFLNRIHAISCYAFLL